MTAAGRSMLVSTPSKTDRTPGTSWLTYQDPITCNRQVLGCTLDALGAPSLQRNPPSSNIFAFGHPSEACYTTDVRMFSVIS
jgi:hypothetical protein